MEVHRFGSVRTHSRGGGVIRRGLKAPIDPSAAPC